MAETGPAKPPAVVELIWEHDLVFGGQAGGVDLTLDGATLAGPSPMQALALALAACMAMDVVHILKKGRHDLRGLKAHLIGTRADQEPRRFTEIAIDFTITGSVAAEQVKRAIDLSREKYCSVWHSLRQDITMVVSFTVAPGL